MEEEMELFKLGPKFGRVMFSLVQYIITLDFK